MNKCVNLPDISNTKQKKFIILSQPRFLGKKERKKTMFSSLTDMAEWFDDHWMFLAPPITIFIVLYRYILLSNNKKERHPHQNQQQQKQAKENLFCEK